MSENASGKTAILVLGMHRSGTSAATRLLNLLGVELGSGLLDGGPDNSTGFWEHVDVLQIHERLLAAFGRTWADVRPMPAGWLAHPAAEEARAALQTVIERDFAAEPLWAIKDPRLCRLVPLWLELLTRRGIRPSFLFVARHPDEVAASLHARNQCPHATGRLLWLQHFFEAEAATRDFARSVVTYEALLLDHAAVTARIARDLRIAWPKAHDATAVAAIADHLDGARQHHHATPQSSVNDTAAQAYALCRDMLVRDTWPQLVALSDAYAATFAVVGPAMTELVQGERSPALGVREAAAVDVAELQRRVGALEAIFGWGSGAAGTAATVSARDFDGMAGEFRDIAARGLNVDSCGLYFRSENEPYSEERSVRLAVAADDGAVRVEFALPQASSCDIVRLDPAETPGIFRIDALYVDGERLAPERFRVISLNGHPLPHDSALVRFSAPFSDPYVEIDLRGLRDEAAPQIGSLAVVFERETIKGHIVQSLRHEQTRQAAEIGAAVEQQGADTRVFLRGELQRLQADLRGEMQQALAQESLRGELDAMRNLLEQRQVSSWWQRWRRV